MSELYTVSASPHITKPHHTTSGIMLDVLIALSPCVIAAILYFGYHVAVNLAVCLIGCVGSELLFNLIRSGKLNRDGVKQSSIFDLSAAVTAVILTLNLPAKIRMESWDLNVYFKGAEHTVDNIAFSFDTVILCLMASVFSVVIVKMMFGGIGKNFANPAAMGRIFLFAFAPLAAVQTIGLVADATTGATWLSGDKVTNIRHLFLRMILGNTGSAAVGETCVIAILIGYAYLSLRRVIDWRVPLIIVGSAAVFALLFDGLLTMHLSGGRLMNNMFGHVLSGGLIFGAVFMATDYSTSPNTFRGSVVFAVGIALITMLIRVFAGYPEGMSFAIVIMNIASPLIDKFIVPKPFGYTREKKARIKKTEGEQ